MNLQLPLHNSIAVRLPQPGDAAASSQHENRSPGHPWHTEPGTPPGWVTCEGTERARVPPPRTADAESSRPLEAEPLHSPFPAIKIRSPWQAQLPTCPCRRRCPRCPCRAGPAPASLSAASRTPTPIVPRSSAAAPRTHNFLLNSFCPAPRGSSREKPQEDRSDAGLFRHPAGAAGLPRFPGHRAAPCGSPAEHGRDRQRVPGW